MCGSGYACGYEHLSFDGGMFGSAMSEFNWGSVGFGNTATSVSANGGSCKYTRYYVSWDPIFGKPSGTYFTLNSRQLVGTNYRDPDLRNGAGDKPGINFNDDIEATKFTGC